MREVSGWEFAQHQKLTVGWTRFIPSMIWKVVVNKAHKESKGLARHYNARFKSHKNIEKAI